MCVVFRTSFVLAMRVCHILKTDEQLIDIIINFGNGETEFHTADIERLIREKQQLEKQVEIYEISIRGMYNTPAEEKLVIGRLQKNQIKIMRK